jgi:hypothetical protein
VTTPLTKPIGREFQHDGALYKVMLSPEGIRVTPKGGRRGVTLSWDAILGLDDSPATSPSSNGDGPAASPSARPLGMPDVVAADVLLLLRRANETLAGASSLIDKASELPSILAAHREPPSPTERDRSDWYVEPLLTLRQVSQLLAVSTRRVRGLPLKAINLDGQIRYQPAELRRFLAAQADSGRPLYRR